MPLWRLKRQSVRCVCVYNTVFRALTPHTNRMACVSTKLLKIRNIQIKIHSSIRFIRHGKIWSNFIFLHEQEKEKPANALFECFVCELRVRKTNAHSKWEKTDVAQDNKAKSHKIPNNSSSHELILWFLCIHKHIKRKYKKMHLLCKICWGGFVSIWHRKMLAVCFFYLTICNIFFVSNRKT